MRALLAIVMGLGVAAGSLVAQDGIWGGIYTPEQAKRGSAVFLKSCSNCHNQDLKGSVRAPALRGDQFLANWMNGSVNALYSKIRFSMPATYPETVSDPDKLDILTYLLQVNGFPEGKAELKQNPDDLEAIQIVKQGSKELPNFALVRVVGCLEAGAKGAWTLARASEPVVTREAEGPVAKESAGAALGAKVFTLVSAFPYKPETHRGAKVEARGLIYADGAESRLNLTAMQVLGSCQ